MRKSRVIIFVAAAAVMLVSGCVSTEQKQRTTSGMDIVNGKTVAIKPYGWFEDCNRYEAGDTIKIAFSSSKQMGFSAHYHKRRTNETVNIMDKSLVDRYEGTIPVEGSEVYCFMWHNENPEDATVTYDLRVERE